MLAFRRPCKACMHLSDFDTAGFNVPRFFARIQCSLTDTSWVPFSMLFTSIYMSFTWLKSRHCVFTQSITCSLLTFDTNLTFCQKSAATGRDRLSEERLREFPTNDAFGRLLRSIIPNDDWHRCNKSRIFKDFISKWRAAACSVFRKYVSSVNNKSNFHPPISSPLPKPGLGGLMIFWLIFFQHPRQFDELKQPGIKDANLAANVFHKKQPNLKRAVS